MSHQGDDDPDGYGADLEAVVDGLETIRAQLGAVAHSQPGNRAVVLYLELDIPSITQIDNDYAMHAHPYCYNDFIVPPNTPAASSPYDSPAHSVVASRSASREASPSDDTEANLTTHLEDAGDESLQRYKESLGLGGGGKDLSNPKDPRVCIIESLSLESGDRPPVTIDLSQPGSEATLKDKPFKIKEGVKFTMVAKFRVQHEILSGLQYVQVVKRKGIRVSKDSEMMVSPAPFPASSPFNG